MDQAKADLREAALRRSGALDGAASVGLGTLAELAKFVAGCEYAVINLLGGTTQYTVAQAGGLPLAKLPLGDSMCLPVVEAERSMYFPDATQSEVFAENPFVQSAHPVRFYAATPLRDDVGITIGTLCVFDFNRVELDAERQRLLNNLADHVREHLELHSQVRQLGHDATHDVLTGVANRALLSERLTRAMTRRDRPAGSPALALIDLDGFKRVNDTRGHQIGDEVLVQVGDRLSSVARAEDTVARLGGDEFVVLYDRMPTDGDEHLQERLEAALNEPYVVQGEELRVSASVGFVRSGEGELGYELLGRADQAMYQHKARTRS
jgi:diguanylate cyclase (GGDEF)-like protein